MIIELLFFFGVLSFAYGIYLVFAEMRFQGKYSAELKRTFSYEPTVSVIAPVKGPEKDLEDNIRGLLDQKYPKNKVQYIFVLDSKKDPAYSTIKKLVRRRAKIVIARRLPHCSGKISALLTGIKHAKNDVLVFLDTDGKPCKDWLRSLVGQLETADLTSGIRFYLPGTTLTSYIRSSWNSIGVSQIFSTWMFAWGVSMAIRKKTFYALNIPKHWSTSLSDDATLSLQVKKTNLKIQFAPKCVLFSHDKVKFHEFLEFSNRQMIILKSYFPKLHILSLRAMGSICFLILLGIVALFLSFYLPALLLLSIVPLYMLKEYIRFLGYKNNLKITGSAAKFAIAGLIAVWIFTYNCLQAVKRNTITWRGRTYVIHGPADIEIRNTV
ncbi:MAG: glycosyltransferase family 2 protein [Candidatus Aenigmarchaeota archaeon]|nr:glycosyltransferase family 2 protein [Candidatus Aenigmarchaeota archaeon]